MGAASKLNPQEHTRKTRCGSLPVYYLLLLVLVWLPTMAAGKTLVVFGDSLSAGYGIAEEESWVHLLGERMEGKAPEWRVVNASSSGETTGGGLRRIDSVLENQEPELIIIQLGGNDGLRGQDTDTMGSNLAGIIERSQETGARVLLAGIEIPPNYGRRYTEAFREQYRNLADEYDVKLLPFLLEDVYDREGMMQDDRIHPTAEAQPQILDNVWEYLEPMLER